MLDAGRPDAVAKQRGRGAMTARERITALLDEGSEFLEYGALARPIDPRLEAPAEGVVAGTGLLHGQTVVVLSYDYTAMGGSQGPLGHIKLDRIFGVARARQCPVVIISEGGGARSQEMTYVVRSHDDFRKLVRLSGKVPVVGIAPGRAFAGHANLLGMTDAIIATRDAAIGIAGPPLVKSAVGTDLTPEEIGRVEVHEKAGTVDVTVDDDGAALDVAREYLAYFMHPRLPHDGKDDPVVADLLRELVPANPRQAFDGRRLVELVADPGTMLELRPRFGGAAVTALTRIGGRSVGVIATNPMVQAGSINADTADKIARFIRLCDSHGIALLFLCDSPGFLVGPQAEEQALIRHSTRVLMALGAARVPLLTVIVRRSYGLAYLAMGALSWEPIFHAVWPSAEFGAMGLSGASAIRAQSSAPGADVPREEVLGALSEHGSAFRMAERLQTDDAIDPGDTRRLLIQALTDAPTFVTEEIHRPIDSW